MHELEFKDLPFSYRLSQGAMLSAVGTLLYSTHFAAPQWPIAAKWGLACIVGCIASFALLTASYVVVRYPYLSLVSTRDGDVFAKHFTSKVLARLTKILGFSTLLILLLVLFYIAWNKGIANLLLASLLAYVAILFGFVAYLCFFYDAVLHPTVATFIRSTLGVGIVLMPLYIPILVIGSVRCRRLLDSATAGRSALT